MERFKRIIHEITKFIIGLALVVFVLSVTSLLVWLVGYVFGWTMNPVLAEIIAGVVLAASIWSLPPKAAAGTPGTPGTEVASDAI